jgi:DNA-directed RNA polymerase specialized sigma subunit
MKQRLRETVIKIGKTGATGQSPNVTSCYDLWHRKERIREACKENSINIIELKAESRRAYISDLRARLVTELISEDGLSLAETARQLGVSTSGISKMLMRKENKK